MAVENHLSLSLGVILLPYIMVYLSEDKIFFLVSLSIEWLILKKVKFKPSASDFNFVEQFNLNSSWGDPFQTSYLETVISK